MITYLNGSITEIGENNLVLETAGIGYEIFCSAHQFYEAMETKKPIKIYIYEHIKEDAYDLYGFKTKEERELFKKLTSVSGIGPKGGMQVLNTYTAKDIVHIILAEDSKSLSRVNGIGPKTAQRLILELKDHMSKMYVSGIEETSHQFQADYGAKDEAVEALIALGYMHTEALQAVSAIFNEQDDSEGLIRKALGVLSL